MCFGVKEGWGQCVEMVGRGAVGIKARAAQGQGWASVLFKRTFRSFRSFPFFSKERNVPSVLFRSFLKNGTFLPFFSVLF